jgi:hypothetical protein
MSRSISVLAVLAIMAAILVAASAFPAFAQPNGQGPGLCPPPGSVINDAAKEPGPVPLVFAEPPGQIVQAACAPGHHR